MKVMIVSRKFPSYHPRAGEPTNFVQKILHSLLPDDVEPVTGIAYPPKYHTIRRKTRWKVGDMASIRVWTGLPYKSKQEEICQVEIKKIFDFSFRIAVSIDGVPRSYSEIKRLANNDGLEFDDFLDWFKSTKTDFFGQIICWSDKIEY